MGEKTEKASPKKLRDARKKGQVAKSQDLPAAFTFIVSIAATVSCIQSLSDQLGSMLVSCFKLVTNSGLEQVIAGMYQQAIYMMFVCSIPIVAVTTLMGVLITFLSVGPTWAPEVFKFDIKKFNPIDNLKGKFKMKTVVELIKSLLKISIAGFLVYRVMMDSLPVLNQAVGYPITVSLQIYYYFLMKVITQVGLFFIIVAIADFIYQRHSFSKEMMMEKFEIKQEYKNSEGDPHIKGKRKQIAHEIAYSEGPNAGVKQSKAVVTNPVHLAIAIGYEKEVDTAPFVLAMGENEMAKRIVKIAEDNNIPVIRNIPLAHQLWDQCDLYEYVPEDTYEAIAEILRWVASLTEQAPQWDE